MTTDAKALAERVLEMCRAPREPIMVADIKALATALLDQDARLESLESERAELQAAVDVAFDRAVFDGEKYTLSGVVEDTPYDYWLWRELESLRDAKEEREIVKQAKGEQE